MIIIGIFIGLFGHNLIMEGVKKIANTTTGQRVQIYIVNSTVGILYDKITIFIKTRLNDLKYKDNKKIYNYIFNLEDSNNIINVNNYTKINFKLFFDFYDNFINEIMIMLDNNKKKIYYNKKIFKLENINGINDKKNIFNDDNTNNFLKYLINHYFSDFKISLYIDNQNIIYIEFKTNDKSIVRKFTYNQLKDNFYKITLCLLEKYNKNDTFDNIHYNNIISFYYSYFNDGISKNFILFKESGNLKKCHLIESEDMNISEDYNPYRENGIIIALEKFTSATYIKIVKEFKDNNNEFSKKVSNKIMNKIKITGDKSTSFTDFLFKSKTSGGGNIELTPFKNNRIDFFKYILYNFNNEDDFTMKYNSINNSDNNKLCALIVTYDIIKSEDDIEQIPSIRINFLNQINKNVEDIDIELHKEQELLNNVSSKNINNNQFSSRENQNNNNQFANRENNTQNVNEIVFNNIRNDINQSFISEIIENFDLTNMLGEINFDINMYKLICDKRKKYTLLKDEDKIKEDINIRNDFLEKNKNYDYNICINLNNINNANNLIYKYKLNINYAINDQINQRKVKKYIKNYCEKCIKNLNINFKLYLLKNNDLNTFFVNLINEGCNIDFVINNDNIYIIINKNDKVIILDCFSVYSLFSLSKNFNEIYYKTSNPEFIYHIRNIDLYPNKKNYTFDKLFKEYNNSYCSISDSMKKLEIDKLFINFEDGLINFISTKPTFINKIKKIFLNPTPNIQVPEIINMENIFYNFNKYNRNFYNFFINQPNITTELIYDNNLLYIKIIDNRKESLVELNLFKNLFIDHNFKLTDLYETLNNLSENPQQINCNISSFKNKKYSFYTMDDIKSIKNNIFNFEIDMITVNDIDSFNKNSNTSNSNNSNSNTSNSTNSNSNTSNSNNSNSTNSNSNNSNTNTFNTEIKSSMMNNNNLSLTNANMTNNNSINIDKNLVKDILKNIYDSINDTFNKYVNLRVEDDKIKIYNPQTGMKNTDLITQFSKLDKLNAYLILLYKNNINKNIIGYRLKIECKILYLEIIYKSRATFGGKNPSLLIDLKKFILKITDTKNFNKLTTNRNYFTTLKSFIKMSMSKNNLSKRKNDYKINNKCMI